MGRSSQEKIDTAIELLQAGKTFREIQAVLQQKFKSSMSFSTLSKLKKIQSTNTEESEKIRRLEQELELFKKLYFDLVEKENKSKNNTTNTATTATKVKNGDFNNANN